MVLFSTLRQRQLEPEIMDQPDLDPIQHQQALRGLARINRWSRTASCLWTPIQKLLHSSDRPLDVLDVACGAGDNLVRLAQRAKRQNVPLRFHGCDISPVALEHAQSRAEKEKVDLSLFHCNILSDELPQTYDVVINSLFLHHLNEAEGLILLQKMSQAASGLLLVNDLNRCRRGLILAWLGSRVLSRSYVVHVDAVLSVRAALTPQEALILAERAGLSQATVRRTWPFRYLLEWNREQDKRL